MFRSFFKVSSEWTVVRRYLASLDVVLDPQIQRLTFSEVRKELEKKETVLLDVREKGELTSDGKIKQSHNIPLGEIESAAKLDNSSFKEKYGFDKPDKANLIIHCKAGVRAMKAAVVLNQAGFSNVRVYDGILDWLSNGGEVVK